MNRKSVALIAAGLLSAFSLNLCAAEPTNQELMELLKKQQAQIEELQKLLKNTNEKVEETDLKVEQTVSVVEETLSQTAASKTSVGGYGELHYSNIQEDETIDFHRFVLFFGHEFSDTIRFFSELELERAFAADGEPGEVALEQAYLKMDLTDDTSLSAGVLLVPIGIINETHEPPTFYGVERNPVEKNILPTTWREAGAGFTTHFADGLSADLLIHSGFDVLTGGSKSFLVRNGRQKAANANADSLAYTARIKYTAIPGLELSASYQIQTDVTQGATGAGANLMSAHVIYNTGKFGVRALYASWNINGAGAAAVGRDSQRGYYLEPSYRINDQFGLFARYNEWDNNAGDSVATLKKQLNFGLNYWPHEDVVFKLDIENQSGAQDGKGFNLGVGYQF